MLDNKYFTSILYGISNRTHEFIKYTQNGMKILMFFEFGQVVMVAMPDDRRKVRLCEEVI
jgi:hypothetical protein